MKLSKGWLVRRRVADLAGVLGLVVACAVVPLVVRAHFVPVSAETMSFWTGEALNVDFFSHLKAQLIIACGVACLVGLLLAPAWRAGAWRYYLGIGVLAVCLVASTWWSDHRALAVWGYPGRYEGALVWGAYLLLFLTALNRVRQPNLIRLLLVAVTGSAAVIAILGLAQYVGHDLMDTDLGRRLLVPAHSPYAGQGAPAFGSQPFTITATLYNPNYVGSYAAMVAPMCLGLYLFAERRAVRAGLLVLTGMLFLLLLGSQSRGGLLAAAVATTLVLAAAWRAGRGCLRRLWPLAAALVVCAAFANWASGGLVVREVGALREDLMALAAPPPPGLMVTRIVAAGDTISFETTRESLWVRQQDGRLEFRDGGHVLRVRPAGGAGELRFLNRRYHGYRVQVWPDNRLAIQRDGLPEFQFRWLVDGFHLLDSRGVAVPAELAQEWRVGVRGGLGSGRIFIWSRTWPLLRTRWWRGDGPDTFAAHFPQHDLVQKANVYGRLDLVVDKPHNAYLQTAVNTGVLSLLGLLVVLMGQLACGVRLYLRRPARGPLAGAGVGLFGAAAGYAVAALFNDSVVSVAPVFWTLLGLGAAVNLAGGAANKGPIAGR